MLTASMADDLSLYETELFCELLYSLYLPFLRTKYENWSVNLGTEGTNAEEAGLPTEIWLVGGMGGWMLTVYFDARCESVLLYTA